MKLVQFGAGNIGRSFIGQLFARGGFEVVFVDVDRAIVEALNREGRYRVIVKRNEAPDETLWVEGVRAIDGGDSQRVAAEIAGCDLIATSVGQSALRHIFPVIAAGLQVRRRGEAQRPLEIIIAENIRSGAALFRDGLREALPPGFPLEESVGLVETSIGKMVPIMTEEDRKRDPLWIFAEAYNTLIVDRHGFLGELPALPGIEAVENIRAYVDRKLFIHNLGHAATAYFGFEHAPDSVYIWEPLMEGTVRRCVAEAMRESAAALLEEYPEDLDAGGLEAHIQDLLARFANRALGDTIFRVGRDLYRKLAREDRLVGACLLAARHALPFPTIAGAVRAALSFRARDERGVLFSSDRRFLSEELPKGLGHILASVCGLDADAPFDARVIAEIRNASD